MSEVKEAIESAVKALHESVESVGEKLCSHEERIAKMDADSREKYEKSSAALDAMEQKNQKLTLELEAKEKANKEFSERIENIEKNVIHSSKALPSDFKETSLYKSFNEIIRAGSLDKVSDEHKEAYLTDLQTKDYLRTDQGEFGGFLVPEAFASQVRSKMFEVSPVRSLATITTTQTKTLNVPILSTLPDAPFEGEAESTQGSTPKYVSETMTAHRQHTVIPVTRDQLNFSSYDMSALISNSAVRAFSQTEGNRFTVGSGVKQPQGFLDTSAGITQVDSASSGVVSMDDVINLAGELKQGYSAVYGFNKKTLAVLRTEKDSNGNYLWRIGGEDQPSTINGDRYVIFQDMPDIASNSLSVVYGDFAQGYLILDALAMELVRDDVTRKSEAMVEFSWNRYLDGRVVLSEAFKILKTKA